MIVYKDFILLFIRIPGARECDVLVRVFSDWGKSSMSIHGC